MRLLVQLCVSGDFKSAPTAAPWRERLMTNDYRLLCNYYSVVFVEWLWLFARWLTDHAPHNICTTASSAGCKACLQKNNYKIKRRVFSECIHHLFNLIEWKAPVMWFNNDTGHQSSHYWSIIYLFTAVTAVNKEIKEENNVLCHISKGEIWRLAKIDKISLLIKSPVHSASYWWRIVLHFAFIFRMSKHRLGRVLLYVMGYT